VPKRRPIISVADLPTVFDDPCIHELAVKAKLPAAADLEAFGGWIREAAEMFVCEVQVPTANEIRSEIARLYKAAAQRDFELAASLLASLSQEARALFEAPELALEIIEVNPQRSTAKTSRVGPMPSRKMEQSVRSLPSSSDLRDDALRDQACVAIASAYRIGAQRVEGRRRSSGRRSSPSLRPTLYAPTASKNFLRREAERNFVERISIAWVKSTDKKPPRTARRADAGRGIGPFARLVQECLRLVGASYADPVALINEVGARLDTE
jgi:hypothetical protein